VIKNRHELDPVKHWELVSRLDSTALRVHGHGTVKEFNMTGGMLSVLFSDCVLKQAELISIKNELSTEYQQPPM
jgi:hypothetical protein